jgi:hypothetical protein
VFVETPDHFLQKMLLLFNEVIQVVTIDAELWREYRIA